MMTESNSGDNVKKTVDKDDHHVIKREFVDNVERYEWDVFRLLTPKSYNVNKGLWLSVCLQVLKISTFFILFFFTLLSGVAAKSTFLLMISSISSANKNISICNDKISESTNNVVYISNNVAAKWVWAVYFAMCMPELMCFIWCFHRTVFRNVKRPTIIQFFLVFTIESLHAYGLGALVFDILPELPMYTAMMLSNALCIVPAILNLLTRSHTRHYPILLSIDTGAVIAQSTTYWIWPVLVPQIRSKAASICLYTTFISLAWWQNFVQTNAYFRPIRFLANIAEKLLECQSKTYVIVSVWKCFIYLCCLFYFSSKRFAIEDIIQHNLFGERLITITANNLTQLQVIAFQERMREYEIPDYDSTSKTVISDKKSSFNQLLQPKSSYKQFSKIMKKKNFTKINRRHNLMSTNNSILTNNKNENQYTELEKNFKLKKKRVFYADVKNSSNTPNAQINRKKRHEFINQLDLKTFMELQKQEHPEGEETIQPYNIYENFVELKQFTTPFDAVWIACFQIVAVIICYHSSKLACKVIMQRSCFALPMMIIVPVTVMVLTTSCKKRIDNLCEMTTILPKEIFWKCDYDNNANNFSFLFWSKNFWFTSQTLLWLSWLLSQIWITIHLWMPKQERLARSEELFTLSYYNGVFIDQSMVLNRRRNDKLKIKLEDLKIDNNVEDICQNFDIYSNCTAMRQETLLSMTNASCNNAESKLIRDNALGDTICKIYICATMWHESGDEMIYMLKSILRMDEDQCARRNAQKYLKVVDPDYYEFEAHIFFDDAFEKNAKGEYLLNKYVRQLLNKMDEAASAVHATKISLKIKKKFIAPYGGRLLYVLPGNNHLSIHLKNSDKIRQRKRWSQVMYLYYLLGFCMMHKVSDDSRKHVIAENTFILTLDGDVDFNPECVHLLVDLMKKNRRLGAACGRIHPRGSGLMIWYQKFEYAVGHWLQKATEHMIGCVLCSPGCFSLFRSQALMDDNVVRKYATKSEKPIHYVQYDQGEDRWLCTLLLQRGYRVEYCAASDALTFAPESFNEFFNQRRRWISSTLANIIDLLKDYQNVIAVNESISIWYILYQCIMLLSSILGPGTIFLMIVGAITISFNIDTSLALVIVALPTITFCICCLKCTSDTQLLIGQLIGALFAMLMTAVVVGTSLQIQKDSIMSPHSIFLFVVISSLTSSALLHPYEIVNIIHFFLYFLAIPCMYMLLPIYSISNLNTVAWGTREDPADTVEKKTSEKKNFKQNQKNCESQFTIGCGNMCQLLCCLKSSSSSSCDFQMQSLSTAQILKFNDNLNEILQQFNNSQKNEKNIIKGLMASENKQKKMTQETNFILDLHKKEVETQTTKIEKKLEKNERPMYSNFNILDLWFNDELLWKFEQQNMEKDEVKFWLEMIEKYLQPISLNSKEQAIIQKDLTALRNKTTSAFFMINIVFIMVVLILQMQKDCLHIEWPIGPKFNHTLIPCNSEDGKEIWVLTRLQLEPIGLVFLVFFMSILVIQFGAMLLHRVGTIAHIIASTPLFFDKFNPLNVTNKAINSTCYKNHVQNAVEIARSLQMLQRANDIDLINDFANISVQPLNNENSIKPSAHRTQLSIKKTNNKKIKHQSAQNETLDTAFRKRFYALPINHEISYCDKRNDKI